MFASLISGETTVARSTLRVDPSAVGSGEERHDGGDVFGLAEPLERRKFAQFVDLRLGLAAQEQLRQDRSWRNGVG